MSVLDAIGNTPLVEIKHLWDSAKTGVRIMAKLEGSNPGGSVKDRPAYFMIREAIAAGKLVPEKTILECLTDYYKESPFVRILKNRQVPDISWVSRTNFCDIGFRIDSRLNRLILVSAIDNLVKGAAGQAVQNMNIMLGIDETTGLSDKPFPL